MPAEKKKHTRRPPDDDPLAPAALPAPAGLALPQGGLRLLAYLLALFPFYGFLLGLIYTPQPNPESKKFGQLCFILAVVGLVGMVFLWGLGALWKGLTAAESGGLGGGYF
jgi:hypothetical protein